jgi:tetratricopeptide (TPR) repeat protein
MPPAGLSGQSGLYDSDYPGMAMPSGATAVGLPMMTPLPQRSRWAVLGWLLLAAFLFGGVGVVLYIAAGERAGKQAREREALAAAITDANNGRAGVGENAAAKPADGDDDNDEAGGKRDVAGTDGKAAPDRSARADNPDSRDRGAERAIKDTTGGKPDRTEKAGDKAGEKAPDKADDRKASKPDRTEKPERTEKPDRTERPEKPDARALKNDGIPRNEKEAKALLAEAKTTVAKLDWAKARDLYARVADGKYHRDQGLLGMAKVAWETRDVDGAIALAQQALKAGAGDPARTLLGHAYFKKNEYAKALQYYEAVLQNRPNDPEVKRSVEALRAKMGGM